MLIEHIQFNTGPHTLERCAEDLVKMSSDLGWSSAGGPSAVVGHSFGGKVALQYLNDAPVKPELTWVS